MFNEYKNGEIALVNGVGELNGKIYKNNIAIVIQRDPYYKDYFVQFKDGTRDWILSMNLHKLYLSKNKKGAKRYENKLCKNYWF